MISLYRKTQTCTHITYTVAICLGIPVNKVHLAIVTGTEIADKSPVMFYHYVSVRKYNFL